MNQITPRNSVLAFIGMASLIVYAIACRPAFSPDGSKVLFPSIHPQTANYSVALYDRNTKKVHHIFSVTWPGSEALILSPQWTSDGRQAVVAWSDVKDEHGLMVALLPLGTQNPTRLFMLPEQKDTMAGLVLPPPILGARLFLGGKSVIRLDLDTGEVKTAPVQGEIQLLSYNNKVYYQRELHEAPADYEMGLLDPDTLSLAPRFQLKKGEVGEIGHFAVAQDGSRMALVGEKDQGISVLVFRGKELEQKIALGPTAQLGQLGNILLSADGKTLYAAGAKALKADPGVQLGMMEISLTGNNRRDVPLLVIRGADEDVIPFFQIALSPDGKTVVASSAYIGLVKGDENAIKGEDLALYLVDLTDPERSVTKVPIPLPPGTAAAKSGQ